DIPEKENYQASNLGNIRNKKTNKILKQWANGEYIMCSPGYVHRLVASAWIPNPKNNPQVNHINEDKTDNRVENLNWMTAKENCNWGTRNKRVGEKQVGKALSDEHRKKLSKAHCGIKLSEAHIKKIRDGHIGHTHSEDTKQKISQSLQTSSKAISQRENLLKKCSFINVNTNEKFYFKSITEATKMLPIS
ncbi:UNVERIFIED_CONTAM: HNH endonuclease, partial [Kocuria sp. CPCC 205274]